MSDNGWGGNWMPPPVPGEQPMQPSDQSAGFDWSWLTQTTPGEHAPGIQTEPVAQTYEQIGSLIQHLWAQATYVSPEDQLTSIIAGKMGLGSSPDRRAHAQILEQARAAAHQALTDPTYRKELVTALGWNTNNAQVQAWIKNGGTIPQNPMGTGGGAAAKGGSTAAAGTPAAAAAPGALAAPFDPAQYRGRATDPGFTYGQLLPPNIAAAAGVDRQWGVDYALPEGAPLKAPFAGTVVAAGFNGPYGNTVMIRLANGVTYRVAHLSAMNVTVGQQVGTGQLLGAVGNTGNSFGAHVLIEMKDSAGNPIDPTPIIDTLTKPGADLSVNGDAYRKYQDMLALISGTPQYAGQVVPFKTPDGHWIYPGSNDYNVYAAAQQLWKKRYGSDPPWSFVSAQIAAGNTTTEQIQSAMDAMSSDIGGMNWGQRDQFSNDANAAATKAWSRPLPDATLKELAAKGITTAGQLQLWITSHPASAIDPASYQQVFDATNKETQPLWGQPPSPDLINAIHQKMQQGPQ